MADSKKMWVLALISIVAIGTVIGFAAQNAEVGDITGDVDGGVFRVRSNGDVDSDGSFVGAGVTISGSISAANVVATTRATSDELALSTNDVYVGNFAIQSGTQLVFIVAGNTNVIDADIDN